MTVNNSSARYPQLAHQVESDIDWAQLWRANRMHATLTDSDLHYWSDRAYRFEATARPSGYARTFLERMDLRDGESIIDMGSGAGTLALPLAIAGHHVTACDYSRAMLDRLKQFARMADVSANVDTIQVSWNDQWDSVPLADVFVASRSLCTRDLYRSIASMEAHTRRRCYMTVTTRFSPHHDVVMLEAIGRHGIVPSEDVYVVNLLMQMGRLPEVSYIKRMYPPVGEDLSDVREAYEREDGPFTPEESQLLDEFIAHNFKVASDSLGVSMVHRSYQREVCWAFIAWDVPAKG